MNILITNDDGYQSYGIEALAKEALKRGHTVYMVAPDSQRSANSHYINIHRPIKATKINKEYDCHILDGTPADCTRIALLSILKNVEIDIVISGINNGVNTGRAIIYSGTCGAAREAVILGKKALATSIDYGASKEQFDNAAIISLNMAEKLYKTKINTQDCFLNLNIPAIEPQKIKGIKMAFISVDTPMDTYESYTAPRGETYYFLASDYLMHDDTEGSDVYYVERGYASLSFISLAEDRNIIEKDFLDKE